MSVVFLGETSKSIGRQEAPILFGLRVKDIVEEVRIAGHQDIEWLAILLQKAVESTPASRGGNLYRKETRGAAHTQADNHIDRVLAALEDPHNLVLVATLDKHHIVGAALVRKDPDGLGIIDELYVDPEARGVGLGEGLLQAALLWCEQEGCIGVDVLVLPGDRSMKNACERAGFKARSLTMHRPFQSPQLESPPQE